MIDLSVVEMNLNVSSTADCAIGYSLTNDYYDSVVTLSATYLNEVPV
jgi:hypothetical protein